MLTSVGKDQDNKGGGVGEAVKYLFSWGDRRKCRESVDHTITK